MYAIASGACLMRAFLLLLIPLLALFSALIPSLGEDDSGGVARMIGC